MFLKKPQSLTRIFRAGDVALFVVIAGFGSGWCGIYNADIIAFPLARVALQSWAKSNKLPTT